MFTTWHLEMNDQTKNANANFKVYLRTYVNWNKNDWINHLLIIEFENNFNVNAFIIIKSFRVIKNYLSRFDLESFQFIIVNDSITRREIKDVDKWVEKMKKFRVYLRGKFKWIQIKMIENVDVHKQSTSKFKVKNMIMLDARFQNIKRINKNLDYKNLWSYSILRAINNCVYEFKLLDVMKNIFFVFYFWLLHLDDDESLSNQKSTILSLVKTNLEEDAWIIDEILKSKIDKRRNDSTTKIKNCLINKIKWQNYDNENIIFT